MSADDFFNSRENPLYLGVNVPETLLMILGGPLVNIALQYVVVGSFVICCFLQLKTGCGWALLNLDPLLLFQPYCRRHYSYL